MEEYNSSIYVDLYFNFSRNQFQMVSNLTNQYILMLELALCTYAHCAHFH